MNVLNNEPALIAAYKFSVVLKLDHRFNQKLAFNGGQDGITTIFLHLLVKHKIRRGFYRQRNQLRPERGLMRYDEHVLLLGLWNIVRHLDFDDQLAPLLSFL